MNQFNELALESQKQSDQVSGHEPLLLACRLDGSGYRTPDLLAEAAPRAVSELLSRMNIPRFYQSVCPTEPDACAAYHAIAGLLVRIDEFMNYGLKRHAESLLWRFDDDAQAIERVLEALRQTGLFTDVREISEAEFLKARSYAV